jgi:hypothetical protein
MNEFQDFKRKFSNNRQWREFVTAVHESVTHPCAVTYPKVISALRSGRDWFNRGSAVEDAHRYCIASGARIPPV